VYGVFLSLIIKKIIMTKPIKLYEIENAYRNIMENVIKTPLEYSHVLSKISGARVFLKHEQLQLTGSFKIRGVLNKIKGLHKDDFQKNFIAASTGNHAAAFAYASKVFGFKGILFMPESVSEVKIKALKEYDVEQYLFGKNSMEAEAKASAYAEETDGILIHPYNDPEIIKGQGTIGIEIKEQCPDVDTVMAPIGGGGLISGLCSCFGDDKIEVVGCQPINASEMYESVKHGKIVPPSKLQTVADATAGGIEAGSLTFDICKEQVKGFELIDEEDIKKAVAFAVKYHQTIIEPGAALPIAALLRSKTYSGKNVVLVLTGKKIDHQLLTDILNNYGDNY
jgi:threonine dehydratase